MVGENCTRTCERTNQTKHHKKTKQHVLANQKTDSSRAGQSHHPVHCPLPRPLVRSEPFWILMIQVTTGGENWHQIELSGHDDVHHGAGTAGDADEGMGDAREKGG